MCLTLRVLPYLSKAYFHSVGKKIKRPLTMWAVTLYPRDFKIQSIKHLEVTWGCNVSDFLNAQQPTVSQESAKKC
ncbi:hypothetical protein VHP8226_01915 [Vibrio hippocampi]|uniref:Uncharacterized protein n=1 Tax=Vibrio hippocampi TaxID=654686 RepID=A0ABM8ZIC1_9VIBR|nr:hypothetical protein VHP8226_01915 [Vibrio hippocampi]